MAIRLERSGGLILIHGAPDPPSKKKWWDKNPGGLGVWVVFTLCIAAVLVAASAAPEWPEILEAAKRLVASVK